VLIDNTVRNRTSPFAITATGSNTGLSTPSQMLIGNDFAERSLAAQLIDFK
jgi:hypothetical protein